MTEAAYEEARLSLTAEDFEFVVRRPYLAYHACGASIIGVGRDMHDAITRHTADCEWKEPTA